MQKRTSESMQESVAYPIIGAVSAQDVSDPELARSVSFEDPEEWKTIQASEYIQDNYTIRVEREEDGCVCIKIHATNNDQPGKAGIAFRVNQDTPYNVSAQYLKACFEALFRHQIVKTLLWKEHGEN